MKQALILNCLVIFSLIAPIKGYAQGKEIAKYTDTFELQCEEQEIKNFNDIFPSLKTPQEWLIRNEQGSLFLDIKTKIRRANPDDPELKGDVGHYLMRYNNRQESSWGLEITLTKKPLINYNHFRIKNFESDQQKIKVELSITLYSLLAEEESIGISWENAQNIPTESQWMGSFVFKEQNTLPNGAKLNNILTTFNNWKAWYDGWKAANRPDKLESVNQGYKYGPFYHLLGNVAEWAHADGVAVARVVDTLYNKGIHPNDDILQINGETPKDVADFWAKVAKAGTVTLKIRRRIFGNNGKFQQEENFNINNLSSTELAPGNLLLTERLLKGGSWYDPEEMLTPYSRTLVVYEPYISNFWDEKKLSGPNDWTKSLSWTLLKKLKPAGFAITIWTEDLKDRVGLRTYDN